MKPRVVALHGFLGRGRDWDAVRAASSADLEWICPDLFAPGAPAIGEAPAFEAKAWLAGYSFGGRLALRWLMCEPQRWHGALLLSVNPGNFQTDEEREERRKSDDAWAAAFRSESWEKLMARWNAQQVFDGSGVLPRQERDFDRAKLAGALDRFSVAEEFTDTARLEGDFVWMAGGTDTKFRRLLEEMRVGGFPGSFFAVPRAGHRLLIDAPAAIAAAVDRLTA
ncbi:MAG: alpha/beta fold hydrolase [Chthoniobacterales bacterium]|nr:alpha/beta fold hydrolase [Chthoniobacterales bacterium]